MSDRRHQPQGIPGNDQRVWGREEPGPGYGQADPRDRRPLDARGRDGYPSRQEGYQADAYQDAHDAPRSRRRSGGRAAERPAPPPQDRGYRDQSHHDQGYADAGYRDQGYQDPGYQDPAYQERGYQGQGYRQDEYDEPERGPWGEREPDDDYLDDPPKRRWGRRSNVDPWDEPDDEEPRRKLWGRRKSADEDVVEDVAAAEGYDDEPDGGKGRARRGRRGGRGDDHYEMGTDDTSGDDGAGRRGARRAGGGGDRPGGPNGGGPGGPGSRRPGSGGVKRGLGVLGWTSIALTTVMVAGTLTAYKVYRDTFGMIHVGKSTDDLDKNRPENATGAINVLLVGSDTRTGDNKKYGQHMENDGERTDTIMLLHIAPNRDGATLISFPRDSMVLIPECRDVKTKAVIGQHLGMINSAFSSGGMICTRRTIETLTKIPIDHWVKVDFTGFKNIVNALGGIEICLPRDVNDKKAKLVLSKGKHIVKGETALAYVRARYGLGDGGDISRIERQQLFISQVVKKATSSGLLTDLGKLQKFVAATADSVTMDDKLNGDALIQIAMSASKLSAKGFKGTKVPWEPYVADKNRVQWKQPAAEKLFAGIRGDVEVTATPSPAASASGGTTKPATPTVTKPEQVKIQVFNGTNTSGKAKEVAEELAAEGFRVVGVGDARKADGSDQPATMIRYTGQGWDQAKILSGKLQTEVKPETGKLATGPVTPFVSTTTPAKPGRVAGPIIQLVVGADWKGVKVALDVGDDAVTSETDICKG
ncbi:LCP family protein [Microtetraspora niveoalba]|uniref:LCP family protein n=1 Tax=Microtetraspora niveoalba TaxID=46175 RepID=UPI000A99943C|nr:LCP family protein [Microtetraspora niveoalba]